MLFSPYVAFRGSLDSSAELNFETASAVSLEGDAVIWDDPAVGEVAPKCWGYILIDEEAFGDESK